jgi:NAD(P)H-dependent FMN reductase
MTKPTHQKKVRVFNPEGLPVQDSTSADHPKVRELRALSTWSEGHVWVCPEQHGTITAGACAFGRGAVVPRASYEKRI